MFCEYIRKRNPNVSWVLVPLRFVVAPKYWVGFFLIASWNGLLPPPVCDLSYLKLGGISSPMECSYDSGP